LFVAGSFLPGATIGPLFVPLIVHSSMRKSSMPHDSHAALRSGNALVILVKLETIASLPKAGPGDVRSSQVALSAVASAKPFTSWLSNIPCTVLAVATFSSSSAVPFAM
jgi:hypothetical protein